MIKGLLVLFFLVTGFPGASQAPGSFGSPPVHPGVGDDVRKELVKLAAEKAWARLLGRVEAVPAESADRVYFEAVARAGLGMREGAKDLLEQGMKKWPGEPRFPLELAGLAYLEGDLAQAGKLIDQALQLSPDDPYANDFRATLYYLRGRLFPALEHWNRLGRPHSATVQLVPEPGLDPLMLNRAIPIAPGELISTDRLRDSIANLDSLGVFARIKPELVPAARDDLALRLRLLPRRGLESGFPSSAVSLLRGLPFERLHFDLYNLDRHALNLRSSLRWASHRRRARVELTRPLTEQPQWTWRISGDLRDEDWRLPEAFGSEAGSGRALSLMRRDARFVLDWTGGRRWRLTNGIRYSNRRWTAQEAEPKEHSELAGGNSLHYEVRADREIVYRPASDFRLSAAGLFSAGRFLDSSRARMGSLEARISVEFPAGKEVEDWRVRVEGRGGTSLGRPPVDEFYSLGIDQEGTPGLRAHPSIKDGFTGQAPLGKSILILRSEIEKELWALGLFRFALAPFCDTGRAFSSLPASPQRGWLVDVGAELRVRIASAVNLHLAFGRDLVGRRTTVFAYPGQEDPP